MTPELIEEYKGHAGKIYCHKIFLTLISNKIKDENLISFDDIIADIDLREMLVPYETLIKKCASKLYASHQVVVRPSKYASKRGLEGIFRIAEVGKFGYTITNGIVTDDVQFEHILPIEFHQVNLELMKAGDISFE